MQPFNGMQAFESCAFVANCLSKAVQRLPLCRVNRSYLK